MNTITVTGQLTADPIPEPCPDALLCQLRLAVQRPHCPERVDEFDVICHGRLAAVAAEPLETGCLVAVTGWLRAHTWPTDDWTGRWIDIVATAIDVLARPRPLSPSDPASDAHLEAAYDDRYDIDEGY